MRIDAADRDRDDQPGPQDEVEHHRRAEPDRAEREPGVGAAYARQRHQPVAERRTGRAPARHDARQRSRAHLDAEHPHPREVLAGRAERCAGEERVREQGGDLEQEAGDQQPRFDTAQLGPCAAKAGDERQHEEVQHGHEGDELEREPVATAGRSRSRTLDLRQLTRHQARRRRIERSVVTCRGVEGGCVHAACAGRWSGHGRSVHTRPGRQRVTAIGGGRERPESRPPTR